MRDITKKVLTVLIIAFVLIGTGTGIYALVLKDEYAEDIADYREISDNFTETEHMTETDRIEEASDTLPFPVTVDFNELSKINDGIVGWIFCEGTEINYPVVQGADNFYYLDYGFNGSRNVSGTIFLDAANSRNIDENTNTVLYGHHMANGTMFGSLSGYKKQEYYDAHPVMYFCTPDTKYRVDIYSCYVGQADSYGFEIGFSDIEDYAQWLKGTIDRSLIIAECSPDVTSQIMTLTTCSYEFDNINHRKSITGFISCQFYFHSHLQAIEFTLAINACTNIEKNVMIEL